MPLPNKIDTDGDVEMEEEPAPVIAGAGEVKIPPVLIELAKADARAWDKRISDLAQSTSKATKALRARWDKRKLSRDGDGVKDMETDSREDDKDNISPSP